ncbi:MAG: Uma2 family endonuclease [Hyphomicrobiales bacterium]|nr:Uma2 family endonuclease [Hyphomicrobiales bacterium]
MKTANLRHMTVDEFLEWSERQQSGRYELEHGQVVTMQAERIEHTEAKLETVIALREAIKKAGLPCSAVTDGATVRISKTTAYEPDALVYCGEKAPRGSLEIPNPVVVVEVLSPGTAMRDAQAKLQGYFSVASVEHYLILNPETRMVTHHARAEGDAVRTRIVSDGALMLNPPGLDVSVEAMFPVEVSVEQTI